MMLDSPAFACSLVRPLLATPVKVLLATDRHENRKFSVRTPRHAQTQSAAAVRAPTPGGAPLGAGFTAASEALGLPLRGLLGTVRNPRFIWSPYARVAQGFAGTNIRKTVPGEGLRRSRLCLRTRLL